MKTPQLPTSTLLSILEANNVDQSKVSVIAIRGYYLDTMGRPNRNDRGIYDDAMFIIHPNGIERFQANTDPSRYRKGRGTGKHKGMALLNTGIHIYGTGLHRGRLAFRQCEPFTVIRDGNPPYPDTGMHAINLHSGGHSSTSSLGCQTIPASTWSRFRTTLYSLLDEHKNPYRNNDWGQRVRSFPYILITSQRVESNNLIVSTRYH